MWPTGIVRWSWTRLGKMWRRSSGSFRAVALVVFVLVLLTGGVYWIGLTLLMLVASISALVGRSIEGWRNGPVVRYFDEVDATHAVIQEQLAWASREIELRDRRIAELQRGGTRGDLEEAESDRG